MNRLPTTLSTILSYHGRERYASITNRTEFEKLRGEKSLPWKFHAGATTVQNWWNTFTFYMCVNGEICKFIKSFGSNLTSSLVQAPRSPAKVVNRSNLSMNSELLIFKLWWILFQGTRHHGHCEPQCSRTPKPTEQAFLFTCRKFSCYQFPDCVLLSGINSNRISSTVICEELMSKSRFKFSRESERKKNSRSWSAEKCLRNSNQQKNITATQQNPETAICPR